MDLADYKNIKIQIYFLTKKNAKASKQVSLLQLDHAYAHSGKEMDSK
jgi:hypothetical protein